MTWTAFSGGKKSVEPQIPAGLYRWLILTLEPVSCKWCCKWCKNRSHRRARQEASGLADAINKNAEKMYSRSGGCGNFGRGDRWQLLTNGELNLHTPTPPVCGKINDEAKLHATGKKRGGNRSERGSKTTAVSVPCYKKNNKKTWRNQICKGPRSKQKAITLNGRMLFYCCLFNQQGSAESNTLHD